MLHFLLIFAFLTAGISPACQFISGQTSLIEICTSDGIKMVPMPGQGAPSDTKHQKSEPCVFCFSSSNLKSAMAASISLAILFPLHQQTVPDLKDNIVVWDGFISYTPRGPPLIL